MKLGRSGWLLLQMIHVVAWVCQVFSQPSEHMPEGQGFQL